MDSQDHEIMRQVQERLVHLEQQIKELKEKIDDAIQKFQGFNVAKQN